MFKQLAIASATASLLIAGPSSAEVIFTVLDSVTNGEAPGTTGSRTLTTTEGAVSAPATLPTMTYTITGLDLTGVGGTASETIVFDLAFTETGPVGTAVAFNSFGNIAVAGGGGFDNQVDNTETLTANVSLNNSTTFTGDIELGIIFLGIGGGQGDTWDVIHDGGTEEGINTAASFAPSSFVTLAPQTGNGVNFQRVDVQVTATPEPGSLALLGLGGLLFARRRRT